jgi:protease IV
MKSFLRTLLAVLIGQVLLVLIVGGVIAAKMKDKPKVRDGTVLVQAVTGAIPESEPAGGFGMPGGGMNHTAILENLEKARHDKRIRAVVLRIGAPEIGWAKMNELRARIAAVRAAGKPVWAYTEGLNAHGLYLGTACDSLFLLRNGYVTLHGFASGLPFVAGALAKLGIKPNIDRIGQYKTAAEMVQRTEMTPESRANVEWMMDGIYPEYVGTVERARNLAPGTLEASVFRVGVLNPSQAKSLGLVDRLVYWDQVESSLLKVPGVKPAKKVVSGGHAAPRAISGDDYAQISRKEAGISGKKKIAVVHATGLIAGDESGMNFPFGVTMGAATMDRAFRAAAEDKNVAAIIFRVDSGGGESATSWRIQRAALQAMARKPMVVSMGDVAGSGGYLICYPCGTLIANPLSTVGSIGSISGKFNMRGLYDKLGITWDYVGRGPNALIDSDYSDYTPEQFAAYRAWHFRDYMEWVEDIARARGKTPAEIDSLGRGRVFTGAQALERGLIDRVGTYDDAIALAKEKAGIPASEEVEFVHYPKKKGVLEALRSGGMAAALFALVEQVVGPFQHEGTWAVDWNSYR